MFLTHVTNRIVSKILIVVLLVIITGVAFTSELNAEDINEEVKIQWDFDYTGESQTFTVPANGNYKVQLWGAEGGAPSDSIILGGKGAYIEGHLTLTKGEQLQVNVGGHPIKTNKGGFNGGGDGGIDTDKIDTYAGGGGGASDIRRYGNSLLDRIGVAAGGGGGGIVVFKTFNEDFNEVRYKGSGGGAGGREVGQAGGSSHSDQLGINARYGVNITTSGGSLQSTGGSQTMGGYITEGRGNRGELGKGGDGKYEPRNPSYSVSGGGGAGYYGGSSQVVTNFYNIPNGGGGSSFIQKLDRYKWSTGWEAQPNPNGGTQNGNSGHGYARITKSNDAPVVSLAEKAEPGKNYHSESSIRYSGTIRDIDKLGGNMTIYSEIIIRPNTNYEENYKQEHGLFKHSTDEEFFTTSVNIPYHAYDNSNAIVRFWAEDSEGLKSEVYTTNILVSRPKDIKIKVNPETETWIRGSYKVNLEIKSANNIKDITTSSGKLNIINSTNKKEQEGYIIVTENKPLTIRVTDIRNNVEEKVFYVNNISDLEVSNLSNNSFDYKINNWGDEYGLDEEATKWEVDQELDDLKSYTGGLSRSTQNMLPNEKVDIRYKLYNNLGLELVNGFTNFQSIYTLAEHPINVEIINVKKNTVTFKINPDSINVNKPRYVFKAIEIRNDSEASSIQASTIVNEGEEITIRNLKPDTLYKLESATINGNGVQSKFKTLKDTNRNDLTFRTAGEMEIDYTSIADWNQATIKGEVKYNKEHNIGAYMYIGDQKIKISDDVLGDRELQSFHINIKKGIGVKEAKLISKPEDAIKIYEVTTAQSDGLYDVYIETVVRDITEEHDLGWFGLDSQGPESRSKGLFKRITKTKGILTIDKDNIKDISTPNHEITIDYGMGRMPLFSNKLITYVEPMFIKLYDKLDNESILAWEFDTNGGYQEGEDDNDIDLPEEKPPIKSDDSIVEVEVPKGGTHMQTSLNGVTWSAWEERRDRVTVSLPTGDGMKSVFVRTGVEMLKETPVYNVELGTIEMVKQKGGEVSPLNNTRTYKFIIDLTAPKLSIRTMDNSLIAINGKITILLDIVDNLDKSPTFVVELLQRDGNGVLESKAPPDRTFSGTTNGNTTGTVSLTNLKESRTNANKLQPYTLKVTAKDAHENKTVDHINFYVKYKQ